MKVTDYIHLYIGCEAIMDGKERGRLIGVDLVPNSVNQIYYNFIPNGETEDTMVPYNDVGDTTNPRIRPILRKISSLNPQEIYTLFSFGGHMDGFTMDSASANDRQIEIHGKEHGNCFSYWKTGKSFSPEETRYLLSISIDLFGLIDAGLAIDKSTL